MSESNIIKNCFECGSDDIVKTLNGTCDEHYHCHTCKQEYFEDVEYTNVKMTAFLCLQDRIEYLQFKIGKKNQELERLKK